MLYRYPSYYKTSKNMAQQKVFPQFPLQKWFFTTIQQYAWCPTLLFVIHVIASRVFGMYELFPAFDIPMHFLGGVCITYFWSGAYRVAHQMHLIGKPAPFFHALLVFAFASTTTIIWEFAEFLCDYYLHTHMQLSLYDTMKDMFLGMCGAVALLMFQMRQSQINKN